MRWIIDNNVDLTAIYEDKKWHLASVISALQNKGIARRDAEAFANFAFADHAVASDYEPEDCVDDEQYERISVAKG